ncbi:Asp23/Gls24 family envelope stress response protein [Nocardia sp. NBC_00416]|uniref:Asp23/Gls24 family envelope stress response protein n=1 Tax=Nocardia sp. NBC_00416 TaxID=2975991 RepID=UPI002E1E9DD7
MTAAAADLPGTTTVSARAVGRIAAAAAAEVAGVDTPVRVDATISGDRTALELRLPIRYPEPVGRVTDICREHLLRRTEELTGLGVARVDIVVTALTRRGVVTGRVR